MAEQKAQAQTHGVSASDLLSATLWQELFRDVVVPESTLLCPVDIRRHRPALGPLYFGNAVVHASLKVKTATLRAAEPFEVARWIRNAVQGVPDNIDAAVDGLEAFRAAHGLAALDRVYGYAPDSGLLISNVSRVPLEPLDFGSGPPQCIEIAPLDLNARACFLLPGNDGPRLVLGR